MASAALPALTFTGTVQHIEQSPVAHPQAADYPAMYSNAFAQPTAGPALADVAGPGKRVLIIICDRTRPVPYHEDDPQGLLLPLINSLESAGVARSDITIIVALGTHDEHNQTQWLRDALGPGLADSAINFLYHDCRSDALVHLGDVDTADGAVPVRLNPAILECDLLIPTGFVEPHFMAGASGGAKLIIPGCASVTSILNIIHGPQLMTDPHADLLEIERNPLQDLFYKTADLLAQRNIPIFNVNVTMQDGTVNKVFTGSLRPSFLAAVAHISSYAEVILDEPVDALVFQAGHITGSNLYQTAKAFFTGSRILKPGGTIILFSALRDGVGAGPGFTDSMRLLADIGARAYLKRVCENDYNYQAEEWQTVMVARALVCGCSEADPEHRLVIVTDWSDQDAYADFPLTFHNWDGSDQAAQTIIDDELKLLTTDNEAPRVAVLQDETIVASRKES